MKSRTSLAFVALLALICGSSRADDAPADEKSKTEVQAPTVPNDPAPVAAGQVLANVDSAANSWVVSLDGYHFVTKTHGNLLGVEVAGVESPLRAHLDLNENVGVLVTNVPNDSEAAKAGLKQHDVIVRLNEETIEGPQKFNDLIGAQQGKEAKLHILRQGKPAALSITLPNTPVYQLANSYYGGFSYNIVDNQYRIGVTLAQADDALRSQLRLAKGEGLVVTEIVADGPAAKAGLKQHDVLTQLDGKRLTTVEDCNAQIQEIKDRKVSLTVVRSGKESSIELAPQLSATQNANFAPYVSTIRIPTDGQNWAALQPQYTAYVDVVNRFNPSVQWYAGAGARGFNFSNTANPSQTNAQQQIAEIKQQLAAMQQSLTALEATLQTPPAEKPPAADKQQTPPQSENK
jgi:membrane-associated protease RseP (regulator of RpoE activity)